MTTYTDEDGNAYEMVGGIKVLLPTPEAQEEWLEVRMGLRPYPPGRVFGAYHSDIFRMTWALVEGMLVIIPERWDFDDENPFLGVYTAAFLAAVNARGCGVKKRLVELGCAIVPWFKKRYSPGEYWVGGDEINVASLLACRWACSP